VSRLDAKLAAVTGKLSANRCARRFTPTSALSRGPKDVGLNLGTVSPESRCSPWLKKLAAATASCPPIVAPRGFTPQSAMSRPKAWPSILGAVSVEGGVSPLLTKVDAVQESSHRIVAPVDPILPQPSEALDKKTALNLGTVGGRGPVSRPRDDKLAAVQEVSATRAPRDSFLPCSEAWIKKTPPSILAP